MSSAVPTHTAVTRGKKKSAVITSLALGAALAGMVALASNAQQVQAAPSDKVVFVSTRTSGTGVNNPTGDYEIFRMNPDGTGVKQLTFNTADDSDPVLSPDGQKIAYQSEGVQTSNPQGDFDVYRMNAQDGKAKENLTHNGAGVSDGDPEFSPDSTKILYGSLGKQASNPEGDQEIYRASALDGTGKKNLSNNGTGVHDAYSTYSPDGARISYTSRGIQSSNPEGDEEIYVMKALDGTGKNNLSNNGIGVDDYSPEFSPSGGGIVYTSLGAQTSNPEGDGEVYRMNALDGKGQTNLSNSDAFVSDSSPDFSPDGRTIAYTSRGIQNSNPDGDAEIYRMNAQDGMGQTNISNNGADIGDSLPEYASDGTKIRFVSEGVQSSNPEGDYEVYRMDAANGGSQINLTDNAAVDGIYVKVVD